MNTTVFATSLLIVAGQAIKITKTECKHGDFWDENRGQCENYHDYMNGTGVYDPMGPEMTGYVDEWVPQTAEDCGPNQAYDSGMYSCYDIGSRYDPNFDPMSHMARGYKDGPDDCGPNEFYDPIMFLCLDIEENYDTYMRSISGPMDFNTYDPNSCNPSEFYDPIMFMCLDINSNYDAYMNTFNSGPMDSSMGDYAPGYVHGPSDCGPNEFYDPIMFMCLDIEDNYDAYMNTFNSDPMDSSMGDYAPGYVHGPSDCGPNEFYDPIMFMCLDIEDNYDDPMGPEMTGYVDTWVPETAEDCGPNQKYDAGMYSCYDIGSSYDTLGDMGGMDMHNSTMGMHNSTMDMHYPTMDDTMGDYAYDSSYCGPDQYYDEIYFQCYDLDESYDPTMNMGRPTSGCGHMEDDEGCCPGFHYSPVTWMCTPDIDIEAMGITLAQCKNC